MTNKTNRESKKLALFQSHNEMLSLCKIEMRRFTNFVVIMEMVLRLKLARSICDSSVFAIVALDLCNPLTDTTPFAKKLNAYSFSCHTGKYDKTENVIWITLLLLETVSFRKLLHRSFNKVSNKRCLPAKVKSGRRTRSSSCTARHSNYKAQSTIFFGIFFC
jgi:hypothetical protein